MILLIWVYYSAQIVLFGAELTHAYATVHGSRRTMCVNAELPAQGRDVRARTALQKFRPVMSERVWKEHPLTADASVPALVLLPTSFASSPETACDHHCEGVARPMPMRFQADALSI